MTFQCEDLRDFGLILVPNTSSEYEPLLADIQRRIDRWEEPVHRLLAGKISPEKRDTSAILLNQSTKTIAEMGLTWNYEYVDGRTSIGVRQDYGGTLASLRNRPSTWIKILGYWKTILPGSKRYLGEKGIAGDNTDVRPPAPDEIWQGGAGIGSGGGMRSSFPIRSITLNLDGVFFSDGGFIGPDREGLWERVTTDAATGMEIAGTARDGRNRGVSATDILQEIETITGPPLLMQEGHRPPPPPPPPPPRAAAERAESRRRFQLQQKANDIERQRRNIGDDATVEWLAAPASIRLPEFHKL